MRRRLLLLGSAIVLLHVIASGQDLTRHHADSMLAALKKSNEGISRIDLLLNLAQFYIFKPGENKIDFDSAMVYINQAGALNKTIKSSSAEGYRLLTESHLVKEKGQKDEAKKMAEKAVSILEKTSNWLYLGKAYYELSTYYGWDDDQELAERIKLVRKAVGAFQQTNDLERKGASLQMLGDLLNISGDNQHAIEALKLALNTYDSIHHTKLQGVYTLLARIYTQQTEHRQALNYALLALKTAEAEKDSSMQLCQINNDIGFLYNSLKDYELSIRYYKAALEVAKKYNESTSIIVLMTGIAAGYSSLGQPEKTIEFLESVDKKYVRPQTNDEKILVTIPYLRAYTNSKYPEKGKQYCETLLKLVAMDDVEKSSKSTAYRTIAGYYFSRKDFATARRYLSENKVYSQGLGAARRSLDLNLMIFIDSAQGRFHEGFTHLREFKNITDSIFSATKAKQLQQLEVEYQTAKKEDSIRVKNADIVVLKQQNQLQQANLRQARLTKNITTAGIIVALIFVALLFRLYRNKQRSSTIISQKNNLLEHLVNEKEWLLKEIHHRVKNNFQTVMGLLGTQSAYLKNDIAINAINNSQQRIQAMSLIHQRLYQSNNLSTVKIAEYIYELVDSLNESFNSDNRIRFKLDIAPVELDLAHCVPLGLILNEAITNSFKYAFPGSKQGDISIKLQNTFEYNFLLTIEDNGIGLPSDFDVNRSDSMGMNMMRGLVAELGGRFALSANKGTRIEINFSVEPAAHHVNAAHDAVTA